MKEIPLTKGKVALVDDADYPVLAAVKWHCTSNGYAARRVFDRPYGRIVLMHRVIMGAGAHVVVDHRDLDHLNNQRHNLRLATVSENQFNRQVQVNNRSGYKGVSFCQPVKKWRARIKAGDKEVIIGYFNTPLEAAQAYDATAKVMHGAFARLNFPDMAAAEQAAPVQEAQA